MVVSAEDANRHLIICAHNADVHHETLTTVAPSCDRINTSSSSQLKSGQITRISMQCNRSYQLRQLYTSKTPSPPPFLCRFLHSRPLQSARACACARARANHATHVGTPMRLFFYRIASIPPNDVLSYSPTLGCLKLVKVPTAAHWSSAVSLGLNFPADRYNCCRRD